MDFLKETNRTFDADIIQALLDTRSMLDNNTMLRASVGNLTHTEREMYHKASSSITDAITALELLSQVKEVNL